MAKYVNVTVQLPQGTDYGEIERKAHVVEGCLLYRSDGIVCVDVMRACTDQTEHAVTQKIYEDLHNAGIGE
jgi:hypothetical protein